MKGHSQKTFFKQEQGFTLMEMMITLFIVCSLIFLPIVRLEATAEQVVANQFIEKIQSELFYLQSVAMIQGERTRFTIYPDLRKVQCVTSKETYSIPFPEAVLSMGSGVKNYRFEAHTGNLGNFERILIRTKSGTYYIKFQLGSGRFYVEKI